MEIKGLEEALELYNDRPLGSWKHVCLMYDRGTAEIWTDVFTCPEHDFKDYHNPDIIDLGLEMSCAGIHHKTDKNVKRYIEQHYYFNQANEQKDPT
ncbi:MAG: hypothetical protein LUH82_07170 [Clostridiales bacterium]|nr:hypothetical protein [Clostridiales bacterium]